MKAIPRFVVVIHIKSSEQAAEQADIAFANGAGGIFLIDHARPYTKVIEAFDVIRARHTERWIGVNFLDLTPVGALSRVPEGCDGLWLDESRGFGEGDIPSPRNFRVFAGSAFKYQPQPDDIAEDARRVASICDVVTTSGDATGQPPDADKLRLMREAIGNKPLALASGVSEDNVHLFAPFVDCFMVATGVSAGFYFLDPGKVGRLAKLIMDYKAPWWKPRKWACIRGHVTVAENCPDVCRKCKEQESSLWLSKFIEVGNAASDGWELVPWDGNPDLHLLCWRKKFGRGHVSVGCGEFLLVVFSYGPNSDDSYSDTRWRKDGNHLAPEEAMRRVDLNKGKKL